MNADRELRAEAHVEATPDRVWAVLGDRELFPEPAGTLVVHRRPVPRGVTLLTRLFAGAFLGGAARHSDDLERDMALSVGPAEDPGRGIVRATQRGDESGVTTRRQVVYTRCTDSGVKAIATARWTNFGKLVTQSG